MELNQEGHWVSVQSFSVNLLKNKKIEYRLMIAKPQDLKNGTIESIEKRIVDLSSYIEYKNQEYLLTIVDQTFNFASTPEIGIKVTQKGEK
jgi:hypothetical protein